MNNGQEEGRRDKKKSYVNVLLKKMVVKLIFPIEIMFRNPINLD